MNGDLIGFGVNIDQNPPQPVDPTVRIQQLSRQAEQIQMELNALLAGLEGG